MPHWWGVGLENRRGGFNSRSPIIALGLLGQTSFFSQPNLERANTPQMSFRATSVSYTASCSLPSGWLVRFLAINLVSPHATPPP